jgi:LmbE family N-acetylglucosaminyl deacetylase
VIDLLFAQLGLSGASRGGGEPVLFVFPHPDDDVFVGGTLSLLARAGACLDAVWMTSGGFDGLDRVREDEMRRAMDAAGVERRHLLRLPDGGMIGALSEACALLHGLMAELRPGIVIGPAFEGGHGDHDATSFAVAEACRRAERDVSIFEYPCYAPDVDAANGLRLGAFPADTPGVRRVRLDKAAMSCKASMAAAYVSQKHVFELLGWRASSEEYFRECPSDRDYRRPPCRGLDSYAHWFNWRSQDRFENLAAAIAACSLEELQSDATEEGDTLTFHQPIAGSD